MGASSSIDLRPEEIEELTELTRFEPKEVKTLYKRFRRLDRSRRGTISADDLLMIPEVVMNPLAARLVQLFKRDGEDRINFRSYAMGLSVFNERAHAAEKAAALFRVFDMDADGFISGADLRAILGMMVGTSLSAASVDAIVAKTIAQCDLDGDGRISLADFSITMDRYPWDAFTVPVKKTSRLEYFNNSYSEEVARSGDSRFGGGGGAPGGAGGLGGSGGGSGGASGAASGAASGLGSRSESSMNLQAAGAAGAQLAAANLAAAAAALAAAQLAAQAASIDSAAAAAPASPPAPVAPVSAVRSPVAAQQ
jgi:hypothetical protein